jgi:cystathionine beta-synthase
MNPAGSVKDRIARRMVLDAEKEGRIKPGDILVEPTSGNTGMGIACCAAAKGYKAIITMPEKMSQEKIDALKGLGATIVRTPTEYGRLHLHSYMGVAFTLGKELPNAHVLNQYAATGNAMSHYDETGQEIWDQTDGDVDYVIMGVGTGGTITGVSRKLKEKNPNIKVIGVDPPGSILASDDKMNAENPAAPGGQVVEGTGYDFLPKCYDQTMVDGFIKGPDKESFIMARRLMKEEGLMCGGSSGQAFWGAI